ncbi:uncharacterized protein [Mytilus edulis]|uniref:uncharacterized protein isoform X1 n=1 Tax=Mytilus edulis TaxID=6550 RepID=UPI0039EE506B
MIKSIASSFPLYTHSIGTDVYVIEDDMYKHLVICFIFLLFDMSAGLTEFPCYFPCPWRNQTFYNFGTTYGEVWKFSADGKTSLYGDSESPLYNLSCYQITERFLILKFADAESYFCFTIFYDPEIPLEIKVGGRNGFDLKNKTGEFTDLCAFCKVPDFLFLYTVETGTPSTPLPLSLDCNRPSSCSPPGVVCNMSDTIPKACSTTTEPITELTTLTVPLTTTADPKTSSSNCEKKKQIHPST